MKILKKADFTAIVLCLLGIIPGMAVYRRLPDQIVTNWSISGEANGMQSKAFVVYGIPLIIAALVCICCIYAGRLEAKNRAGKLPMVLRILLPATFYMAQGSILLAALGLLKDLRLVISLFASAFMIVLGNYMPKIRKNWVVGIRTPHIVKNEEIWYKTHRFAAVVFMAGGVLAAVTTLCGWFITTFCIIMAAVLIPFVYGEAIYYAGKKKKNP